MRSRGSRTLVMERVRAGLDAVDRPWADVESDLDWTVDGEIKLAEESADKLADKLAGDWVDTRSGDAVKRLIVLQFLRVMTSKVPPSAKCCFWALVHPPKTASMVKSSTLGNCSENSAAILALRGR